MRFASNDFMNSEVHEVPGARLFPCGLDGDLVVVDRSLNAHSGHVVVAVCNGETMIKRLRRLQDGRAVLQADNPDFPELAISEDLPAEIWGVVVG